VLVDPGPSVVRAWSDWGAEHGLDPDLVMGQIHGRPSVDSIRALAPEADAEAESRALDERQADDTDGVRAVPGAHELLAALPAGSWAVVTSSRPRLATARIAATGLPLPGRLVTPEDVGAGKPDPEGYLAAARALGRQPGECIVVEDAPRGVEAGRAAAMRVLALRTTHGDEELGAATIVVDDLRDVRVDGDALLVG
jgi:sugar-phosphatase